jgi:hypothetical protein
MESNLLKYLSIGVLEYWSIGKNLFTTLFIHHSITPINS